MVAYLRLAAGLSDVAALRRVINLPPRKLVRDLIILSPLHSTSKLRMLFWLKLLQPWTFTCAKQCTAILFEGKGILEALANCAGTRRDLGCRCSPSGL